MKRLALLATALIVLGLSVAAMLQLYRKGSSWLGSQRSTASVAESQTSPALSTDGNWVYFDDLRADNTLQIVAAFLPTSELMVLTPEKGGDFHPILAPQNERLAFARQTNEHQHIWLMSTNGSNRTQITFGEVVDVPVTFSADGIEVYFLRTSHRPFGQLPQREIFRIAVNRSDSPTKIGNGLSCSADGQLLASEKFDLKTGRNILLMRDSQVGRETEISVGYLPSFSADGRSVTFLKQNADYSTDVVTRSFKENRNTQLKTPHGYKTGPLFSSDGRYVSFRIPTSPRDGDGGLFKVEVSSGQCIQLLDIPGGRSPRMTPRHEDE